MQSYRAFQEHEGQYDAVFFGDSHSLLGVCPNIVGNVLNMSELNQGYMLTYYKLRSLLKEQPDTFKTVVLHVELHSFSGEWGRRADGIERCLFINELELGFRENQLRECVCGYFRFDAFPYSGLGDSLHEWSYDQRREGIQAALERVYSTICGRADIDTIVGIAMEAHYPPSKSVFDGNAKSYAKRVVDLCRKNNLGLILVRCPVTGPYASAAQSLISLEEYRANLAELTTGQPDIKLLDYGDLFLDRDDYFCDANHLNAKGAIAFSRILREDLIKLGVVEPGETGEDGE